MTPLDTLPRSPRLLLLTAAALTLPACGSRPTAPLGEAQLALRAPSPPPARGLWRFYSVVDRVDSRGNPQPCADPPLPGAVAALRLPIDSAPLFTPGRDAPTPGGADFFCVHTAQVTAAEMAVVREAEADAAPSVDLLPPTVYTQSEAADRAREIGLERFRQLAGLPEQPSRSFNRVQVVVLDTAAAGVTPGLPGVGAVNPHGEDMALMVRSALCPDNAEPRRCGFFVDTAPALDLVSTDDGLVAQPDGGHFGDPGQLARAVHEALRRVPAETPLVINLSIGWDDRGAPNVSTRAAQAAIELARARGAVVVAAAGNLSQCSDVDMSLPGAWSQVLFTDDLPLVVSAAAVDADGELVGNARRYRHPPTVRAFGEGVPADPRFFEAGAGERPLDGTLWTGSSVAAVVASATAARRLSAGLTASEIITELMQVDDPAPGLPDRRMLRVCAASGLPCPELIPVELDLGGLPVDPRLPVVDRFDGPGDGTPNQCGGDGVKPGTSSYPTCDVCGASLAYGKLIVTMSYDATSLWIADRDPKIAPRPLTSGVSGGQTYVFDVQFEPNSKPVLWFKPAANVAPLWLSHQVVSW